MDNTLFTINSKRTSPVEVASEAIEEAAEVKYVSSGVDGLSSRASAGPSGSNSSRSIVETPAVVQEPQVTRDGVVSIFLNGYT
jgi:hypothetical protein